MCIRDRPVADQKKPLVEQAAHGQHRAARLLFCRRRHYGHGVRHGGQRAFGRSGEHCQLRARHLCLLRLLHQATRLDVYKRQRVTITNSCAANVLGLVKENDYSYGIVESARKCMQPLADYLGVSVEECARQILHKAFEKIEPVIDELVEKYRIEKDQSTLVGVGGGASALLPYLSLIHI